MTAARCRASGAGPVASWCGARSCPRRRSPRRRWRRRRDHERPRARPPHLAPKAPRLIQRGNGHTGEAHGFAANLAKAKRILWPAAQEPPTPVPVQNPVRADTGRHRAPPTTGSGRS
ncbi:DUF6087 family protein [Streptomyces albidoflavus]